MSRDENTPLVPLKKIIVFSFLALNVLAEKPAQHRDAGSCMLAKSARLLSYQSDRKDDGDNKDENNSENNNSNNNNNYNNDNNADYDNDYTNDNNNHKKNIVKDYEGGNENGYEDTSNGANHENNNNNNEGDDGNNMNSINDDNSNNNSNSNDGNGNISRDNVNNLNNSVGKVNENAGNNANQGLHHNNNNILNNNNDNDLLNDNIINNNNDNDLLNDNNNSPNRNLGGFRNAMKEALDQSLKPLKEQVATLKGKLSQLNADEPDIGDALKPFQQALKAEAQQEEERQANLQNKVRAIASDVNDLQHLKEVVAVRATKEQLDGLQNSLGRSTGKVASNVGKMQRVAGKNQKYLKRIYKDLHHR